MAYDEFRSAYRNFTYKKVLFVIICSIAAVVILGYSLTVGDYSIGFIESYEILWNHIIGATPVGYVEELKDYIIWDLRLPRVIGAVATGITLAVGGVAMQSTMKNPLADPYTTGISSGAGFGVALMTIMGITLVPLAGYNTQLIVNAFVFSLIPVSIILLINRTKHATPTRMILTGIAVMYLFSAVTSLMMLIADPDDLADVYRWNLGNLGAVSWSNIVFIVSAAVFSTLLIGLLANRLNIVAMKDEAASSLGVNPNKVRCLALIFVSLTTATVVSFTGTIGFMGLVVPHMARLFVGSDNRYLVPASAAFGGMFLLAADSIAKGIIVAGLPVGVITSLVGGPLFLYILVKNRKNQW